MNRGMEGMGGRDRQEVPGVRARALSRAESDRAWVHSPGARAPTAHPDPEPRSRPEARGAPPAGAGRAAPDRARRGPASLPRRGGRGDRRLPARRRLRSCWSGCCGARAAAQSLRAGGGARGAASARRRAGHALVPRRRPPAEALTPQSRAAPSSATSLPGRAPTGMPGAAATACMRRRGGVLVRLLHVEATSRRSCAPGPPAGAVRLRAEAPQPARPRWPRDRADALRPRHRPRPARRSTAASGATRCSARSSAASRGCARAGARSRSRRWPGRSASS